MDFFEIEVSNLKAANINTGNLLSYSPYVRAYVGDTSVGCTQIMVRTENPKWRDKLTFTVPQISNTVVLFKVYDAVIIGEDTLLGFVEVPLRLENSSNAELSGVSPLRDGVGLLQYQMKCTPLPLTRLSAVSDTPNRTTDRYTQLGLHRSLLPRNIRPSFLQEFDNCTCSRATSNLFAIDAVRDFEELFTLPGHALSLQANPIENTAPVDMDVGDSSPVVIDGRVQGSIVEVGLPPPPELLKMCTGEDDVDTPKEASQSTVSVIRLRPCYGEVVEKRVCVGSSGEPLHVSWSDVMCTDRLCVDGIVIDIVTTCLHLTEKKPTATDHAASGQDAPLPSEVNTDSGKLQCRAHFTYQELLESGKGSTGVGGEMIIDNKLKLRPCPRREFEVSLSGGSTASGADTWGLLSVTVCNSMEEMVQKMAEKDTTSAATHTQQPPFACRPEAVASCSSQRLACASPRDTFSRRSPTLMSETLAMAAYSPEGDDELCAKKITAHHIPHSQEVGYSITHPPLLSDSPKRTLSPYDAPETYGGRARSPPLSGLVHDCEASAAALTGRDHPITPMSPPERADQSTPARPFQEGVSSEASIAEQTASLPLSPPADSEAQKYSTYQDTPPVASLPPTPRLSFSEDTFGIDGPPESWLDEYDGNAALLSTVPLDDSPRSPKQQIPAPRKAQINEKEMRVCREVSGSESGDLFAHWTEALHDNAMDSLADSSTENMRMRIIETEEPPGACLGEYLVIDLRRNGGNLLVGFQKKEESVEGPHTLEAEARAGMDGPSSGNEQLKAVVSRSQFIRLAVPLPARMLSAQCLSAHTEDPMKLRVVLPHLSGSSIVNDCVLSVCCRAAAPEASDITAASSSSYRVHLRWTVSNPSSIGFTVDNMYNLSQNQSAFRASPIGINAFSMTYRCREHVREHRSDKFKASELSSEEVLIDLSPVGLCVFARDSRSRSKARLDSSPRKVGVVSRSSSFPGSDCDTACPDISPVPATLRARVSERKKEDSTNLTGFRKAISEDDVEDESPLEDYDATECGAVVDLTPFLRSDESPSGYTLSVDVYENQFMPVLKEGGETRRGQRWMPFGSRASLSSQENVGVGPLELRLFPKEAPECHTFSDCSGEKAFPTYPYLAAAVDEGNLMAQTNSISEYAIEVEGFEVSSDWVLVKAFGMKGMGYETRMDMQQQQQQQEVDYDDLRDDDGECWWYAATLENLLNNTACYHSYYPGCLYRRRCWRKYLRHKVSSLLRFEDIHRKMNPLQLQSDSSYPSTDDTKRTDEDDPLSPRNADINRREWNWADVTDCQQLSRSAVAITVKTGMSDDSGVISTRCFIIGPCCAKRIVDIIALRRGLAETRDMIERTVIPAIRSGRKLLHCNRIDSSGYITIVGDLRKEVQEQRAISRTMLQLRQVIEDTTVKMIPELCKRCRLGETSARSNLIECDLLSFSSDRKLNASRTLCRGQPLPLTVSYPDITDCPRDMPEVEITFLILERLVGYYRLLSRYAKHGSALLKSPLRDPTLLAADTMYSLYMSDSTLLKNRASSMTVDVVTSKSHTMWKVDAEDERYGKVGKVLAFFRPDYTMKDILVYITHLMSSAVDGILCTQKDVMSTGDMVMATHRYLETLSEYANNCVCKIVSVIRAIIAWNSVEDVSSKAGPWADGFLPLTTFIMRNNPRLMLTLLAVTTAPFEVKKVPCFSRYTGIRTLIHWELQPRARSLFLWVNSLRNGGLRYILEV